MAFRPRILITEKESKNTKHYRVLYNDEGRIERISHHSKGLLNDQSYFGAAIVQMDYMDTKLVRTYFDHNNRPAHVSRHFYGRGGDQLIHKEVFELDSLGRRQSLALFNKEGEQIETGYGTYRFEWETLNDGSFIQKAFRKNGEINVLMDYFDFLTTHITLDEKGYLDLIKNLGEDGNRLTLSERKRVAVVDFEFDEYGNEVSYSFLNEHGELVNRQDTGFGSYGYAKVSYVRKTPSKGINDGYETIFFDHRNERTTASDGIARQVESFNNNGV